jgi:hypothetical protein
MIANTELIIERITRIDGLIDTAVAAGGQHSLATVQHGEGSHGDHGNITNLRRSSYLLEYLEPLFMPDS